NYVAEAEDKEYGSEGPQRREERRYYNRVESCRLEEFDEVSEMASAAPTFGAVPPGDSLENMIRDMDATFSDTLIELIDATGEKRSDVYKRAQISKQHFSKINSDPDYNPLKPTVIAFAMALRLSVDETEALLEKAGYSLSNSILFDVIVMYFLEQKNYDIFELNEVLELYDQQPVGNSAA
ncbi:MAG: RNase III inhibitor, partial [Clostridia bacterium]|nr:RNase III inhibitor [Clostridia bacterium]